MKILRAIFVVLMLLVANLASPVIAFGALEDLFSSWSRPSSARLSNGVDFYSFLSSGDADTTNADAGAQSIAGGSTNKSLKDQALNLHNSYRESHGVPPLKWSDTVEQSAQAHADKCIFRHTTLPTYGENLAWGHADIASAIRDWYNEISMYNYNSPGYSFATGHFTQMIWKKSVRLGCALGNCPGRRNLWVCQYDPPGNYIGQFPANVPKKGI